MTDHDTHTLHEIRSQPEAWAAALAIVRAQADALRAIYRDGGYDALLFTGCGSPYYLALSVAALFQELSGVPARGLPASEIWLAPQRAAFAPGKTLLVAASRSGETTELLRACAAFRASGAGKVVTLCAYPDRPLAALGDMRLILPSAQEQSVAQTRAFSTLYLAVTALAALWAGRDDLLDELEQLPGVCCRLLAAYGGLAQSLGGDATIDRFYFLGSGPRYGLACELSLKLKEMSLSHSEPFHVLEFRHGPKAMATDGALVVGLISAAQQARELAVLDEARAQGARTLAIGEDAADVAFASGLSEAACGALYLPFGQLLAYERALHHDQNPDRPQNLDAFVTLEG